MSIDPDNLLEATEQLAREEPPLSSYSEGRRHDEALEMSAAENDLLSH